MIDRNDFRSILLHGFKYNHHLNPAYPELSELTEADVVKLDPKHDLAQKLVKTTQESDANYIPIGRAVLGREPDTDGDPGPTTRGLIDLRRCECPDFALATLEDTGTGSWPHSCDPAYQNIHTIVMAVQKSNMQAAWLNNLETIFGAITKAQNAVGQHPIWRWDLSGSANMKISWGPIGGSTIGWNSVPSNFSCGLSVTGKIDTTWSPSDWKMLGRLGLHEWFGHGNGYGHTRGGIMNPSILSGEVTWVGDQLHDKMVKNFGGPIDTPGGFANWGTTGWL